MGNLTTNKDLIGLTTGQDKMCHSKHSRSRLKQTSPSNPTLAAASRLAAKLVGDHLPSGLGKGQVGSNLLYKNTTFKSIN